MLLPEIGQKLHNGAILLASKPVHVTIGNEEHIVLCLWAPSYQPFVVWRLYLSPTTKSANNGDYFKDLVNAIQAFKERG